MAADDDRQPDEGDRTEAIRLRVSTPLTGVDERIIRDVIGCGIRVHIALGSGFSESIYHRAMEVELSCSGIEFVSELSVPVVYRGITVGAPTAGCASRAPLSVAA